MTSTLFLNATQVGTVKVDVSVILIIDDNIEQYHWELQLLIDLQKELYTARDDNTDFTCHIGAVEKHLEMANRTIRLLQNLTTNTLTLQAIELSHPPKYSGDRKEVLNFISKVHLKLVGENSHFPQDQHKLHYIYDYLKGNDQNQIQPYVQMDNILLDNVEAMIKILEATYGDPNEVRIASAKLDRLSQGNHEFSIYYAKFQ
jgi:hypothetical protein